MALSEEATLVSFLIVWFGSFYAYYFEYLKPWLKKEGINSFHHETIEILSTLRNPNDFGWWIIPIFTMTLYFYAQHFNKSRWNVIAAGLSFFGMDILNELINVYITHDSKYAALWMVKGRSCFVVLIGWNIEIILMFAFAGIAAIEFLPQNKNKKILMFPFSNRWIVAFMLGWLGVIVEVFLNWCNVLIWCWPQWSAQKGVQSLIPIWFFGYFHFMVVAVFTHDMKSVYSQFGFVFTIYLSCVGVGCYLYLHDLL